MPFNLISGLVDKCTKQFTLYSPIVTLLILFAILLISQLWTRKNIESTK